MGRDLTPNERSKEGLPPDATFLINELIRRMYGSASMLDMEQARDYCMPCYWVQLAKGIGEHASERFKIVWKHITRIGYTVYKLHLRHIVSNPPVYSLRSTHSRNSQDP